MYKKKTYQGVIFDTLSKEAVAIDFIQKYEPEEGYFVGFSGGKDSVVVLDLVQKAGVKYKAYYSATGIDPPELVKFINKNYPYVIHKRPLWKGHRSFFGMLIDKGIAPTMFTRWCCNKLKKDPTNDVPLQHRIMGIRAEESFKRRKRGLISNRGRFKIYHPIFSWLEWEIWDYIERNNLPYCVLYDNPYISRIGCVLCPFLSYEQHKIHRSIWPKYYIA